MMTVTVANNTINPMGLLDRDGDPRGREAYPRWAVAPRGGNRYGFVVRGVYVGPADLSERYSAVGPWNGRLTSYRNQRDLEKETSFAGTGTVPGRAIALRDRP